MSSSSSADVRRPNILWLMCDQLNASVLGCYGGQAHTPNLDRLAAQGVRFSQAVCPTPYCSPSRASMVTGLYPHAHGINYNVNIRSSPGMSPLTEEGIKVEDVTLGSLLYDAGYNTEHHGKWHLLDDDLPYYPDLEKSVTGPYRRRLDALWEQATPAQRQGWMRFYNQRIPVEVAPALQEAVRRLGSRWDDQPFADFLAKMGRSPLPADLDPDVLLTDHFLARLQAAARSEAPFMLTCSWNNPHDPNVVPSPYYEMYVPEDLTLPDNYGACDPAFERDWSRRIVADLGEEGAREFLRIYYASVTLIDDQVGRILDALERTGRADNTLVVFTSDHGDMAAGHGMVWKSTRCFYDEVLRVPLLVRWPGRIRPAVSDINANLTDLTPTLLEAAGVPAPAFMQGISLLGHLLDPAAHREDAPPYAYAERLVPNAEHTRQLDRVRGGLVIRNSDWKYVRYTSGEEFLYDRCADPGEVHNLAQNPAFAEQKRTLRQELAAWLEATDAPPLAQG